MFYKPKRKYLPGFVRPRPVRAVIWLCKRLIDPVLENMYGISSVSVRPEELERFARYRGQRMMLVPNHPTAGDPAVIFKLSKLASEDWYYLSNREQFDRWFGMFGRLLRWCGAYSVARGTMDKQSFLTTKALLVDEPNKLVVFGEGGAYSWNDLEAPFQEGLFKLALLSAQEVRQKGLCEPVWVQPVAIKYVFGPEAEAPMMRAVQRMEDAVGLQGDPPADFRERILRLGAKIVGAVEQGFFGKNFEDESPHERIVRVREEMLRRFAQALGTQAPPPDAGSLLERTRALFEAFYRVNLEGRIPANEYEERLFEQDMLAISSFRRQLERLENWAALKEGYLAGNPSLARKVEVVMRLEREVFGTVQLRIPRKAVVRLGEPFDLLPLAPADGKLPKELAAQVTRDAEERVRAMLQEMRL